MEFQHLQHQLLFRRSAGDFQRRLTHLGALLCGHGELSRQADVAAQRTDLVLCHPPRSSPDRAERAQPLCCSTCRADGWRCPEVAHRHSWPPRPALCRAFVPPTSPKISSSVTLCLLAASSAGPSRVRAAHASRSGMRTLAACSACCSHRDILGMFGGHDLRDQYGKIVESHRFSQGSQRRRGGLAVRMVEPPSAALDTASMRLSPTSSISSR